MNTLMTIGLVLLLAGAVLFAVGLKRNSTAPTASQEPQPSATQPVALAEQPTEDQPTEDDTFAKNKVTGDAFEGFIVDNICNENKVKTYSWTGDKTSPEGNFSKENYNPDLVFTLNDGTRFAVECKFRSQWKKHPKFGEQLQWSNTYSNGHSQRDNYASFAKREKIPVVVVIGVGGTPDNPAEVYCFPLDDLRHNFIQKNWAKTYLIKSYKYSPTTRTFVTAR